MDRYRVVAGYATAETQVTPQGGRARVDIPRGELLPDDVPQEDLDRLLAAGEVVLVDGDGQVLDAEAATAKPRRRRAAAVDKDPVPAGTVEEVMAWVGDDPARAKRALEAEHLVLVAGEGHTELVDALRAVVDGAVPGGSIPDVLAWVGGDPVRAQRALDAELAKGDKARTSLVDELTAIVAAAGPPADPNADASTVGS